MHVKKGSIARNLTISLFVLVIVVEGVLLAFIYSKQAQLQYAEIETKADDYADYLSEILIVPIWDYDDEQIERVGIGFAKNELVDELNIYDAENEFLYRYRSAKKASARIKRSIVIRHKDKQIGLAELYLTLDAYTSELAWNRNSMISVLVTSLIVILITTGFLLRYFIRNPIRSLQKGLDRVAEGDYAYKFVDIHHQELSGIATRIEEMALEIQKREQALHEMNQELKQEISIRKTEAAEKIKLEKQLQQAHKMEAIGTLAGGVAHDLNNILSGIVTYPDLVMLQLPDDSPLTKPISAIKDSGLRAAAIVQDLLTLARRGVATTEVVNLNSIIADYLESPEYEKLRSFHPRAKLKFSSDEALLNIMGSPIHLLKTIMNLVSNAAEAMPEGGEVIITTANRYIEQPVSGYDDIEEGEYVVLAVSDTGIGISTEERERIFEPFYTKKVMGRSGTGLGMAVVWGTVKDHRGYIEVESTVNQGTTFTLYIPATRQQISDQSEVHSIEAYRGHGESILVVDDMQSQRDILKTILEELGYAASAVTSGAEAVEFLKTGKADLLILDMLMEPGIDGLETYQRVLEVAPGQKAIIASGFSETDRVKEALKLGVGAYIKKPYTLEKIGMAVSHELKK